MSRSLKKQKLKPPHLDPDISAAFKKFLTLLWKHGCNVNSLNNRSIEELYVIPRDAKMPISDAAKDKIISAAFKIKIEVVKYQQKSPTMISARLLKVRTSIDRSLRFFNASLEYEG